jgi:hypothetical protein
MNLGSYQVGTLMKFAKDFIFLPTNIWTKKESEDRSRK